MPTSNSGRLSQHLAIALLFIIAAVWANGVTGDSVHALATWAGYGRYNGVEIWSAGHYESNPYRITGFSRRWGFCRITGIETGRPVLFIIAPHWLFVALACGLALWFAVATIRRFERRQRAAAGLCVSCGYSLAGSTSAVCPECGLKLKHPPFVFHDAGIDVSEGVIESNRRVRYALTISTCITPANPVEVQIRRVNEALLAWLRLRAGDCARLVLSFRADPSQEPQILSLAMCLIHQDIPAQFALDRLAIELVVRDLSGKPVNRAILGSRAA